VVVVVLGAAEVVVESTVVSEFESVELSGTREPITPSTAKMARVMNHQRL
jgi:hypothetical protein